MNRWIDTRNHDVVAVVRGLCSVHTTVCPGPDCEITVYPSVSRVFSTMRGARGDTYSLLHERVFRVCVCVCVCVCE